ncbi:hypothetical protein [Lysobacter sp. CA199]|uniref:hypothetical protein n=1 Tax=Lysobacter sp. CA199 TaxID=3455608 RepID=UPI003F8D0DD4
MVAVEREQTQGDQAGEDDSVLIVRLEQIRQPEGALQIARIEMGDLSIPLIHERIGSAVVGDDDEARRGDDDRRGERGEQGGMEP